MSVYKEYFSKGRVMNDLIIRFLYFIEPTVDEIVKEMFNFNPVIHDFQDVSNIVIGHLKTCNDKINNFVNQNVSPAHINVTRNILIFALRDALIQKITECFEDSNDFFDVVEKTFMSIFNYPLRLEFNYEGDILTHAGGVQGPHFDDYTLTIDPLGAGTGKKKSKRKKSRGPLESGFDFHCQYSRLNVLSSALDRLESIINLRK